MKNLTNHQPVNHHIVHSACDFFPTSVCCLFLFGSRALQSRSGSIVFSATYLKTMSTAKVHV